MLNDLRRSADEAIGAYDQMVNSGGEIVCTAGSVVTKEQLRCAGWERIPRSPVISTAPRIERFVGQPVCQEGWVVVG